MRFGNDSDKINNIIRMSQMKRGKNLHLWLDFHIECFFFLSLFLSHNYHPSVVKYLERIIVTNEINFLQRQNCIS